MRVMMDWNNKKDITNGIELYAVSKDLNVWGSDGKQDSTVVCVNSSGKLDKDNNMKAGHIFCEYIKTNIPGPGCEFNMFSEQFSGCSCTGVCSPDSCACLKLFGCSYTEDGVLSETFRDRRQPSRPVLECGGLCQCGANCVSRIVQKGITKNFCIFETIDKGLGLRLSEHPHCDPIPAFAFVCEYAGEVIGREEAKRRVVKNEERQRDNYVIALREHVGSEETCTYIDPSSRGNLGRFINHSCDPNLVMVPVRVNHPVPRLALFARREIVPGDELTFDYSGASTFVSSIKRSSHNADTGTSLLHSTDKSHIDEPVPKKSRYVTCPSGDLPCCHNKVAMPRPDTNNDLLRSERHKHQDTGKNTNSNKSSVQPPNHTSPTRCKLCCCKSEYCRKYLPFYRELFTGKTK